MKSQSRSVLDTRVRGYDDFLWSRAARAVGSLPPCGGELERGVPRAPPLRLPPSLTLPLVGRGIAYGFLAHIALPGDLDSEGVS